MLLVGDGDGASGCQEASGIRGACASPSVNIRDIAFIIAGEFDVVADFTFPSAPKPRRRFHRTDGRKAVRSFHPPSPVPEAEISKVILLGGGGITLPCTLPLERIARRDPRSRRAIEFSLEIRETRQDTAGHSAGGLTSEA